MITDPKSYKKFKQSKSYRLALILYFDALVISMPATQYAFWVLHNQVEFNVFWDIGLALFAPFFIMNSYLLWRLHLIRRALNIRIMVDEAVLEILDPDERIRNQKLVAKMFKEDP